jgi:hypothetical protein
MANESQNPAETANPAPKDDGNVKAPTVGIEQIEALKAELEATKKAQAGSDQKVARLLSELEQNGKAKQTDVERIAALEKKAADADREIARERFNAAGYKLGAEYGIDADVTAAMVDKYTGTLDELKAIFAKLKAKAEAAELKGRTTLYQENQAKPGPSGPPKPDIDKMSSKEKTRMFEAEFEKRLKDRGA